MAKVSGLPAKLSFEQAYNLDAQAPFRLYFPEESARHVVDSLLFKRIQETLGGQAEEIQRVRQESDAVHACSASTPHHRVGGDAPMEALVKR